MRTVFMVLWLAGAAWAQQRSKQETPPPPGGAKLTPRERPPEFSARGGLELGYDDNILEMNEKQIRQLDSGTRPEKFRVSEADDFVASPWVEARVKARLVGDPTTFGLKAQANGYQENPIANYEEFDLFVAQDLGKHEAGLHYEVENDVYHRELEIVVPGPNLWESAYYTQHELEAYYRHRATPWLTVRPFAGLAVRDFESPFGYRDLEGFFLGVRPAVEFAENWTFSLRYAYQEMDSSASSIEVDTSYRQHEIEPELGVVLLEKRLDLSLRHRLVLRDYTTSNSPLVDPDHLDREDERQRTILEARLKVHKNWALEARYIRRVVDSDRPFQLVDTAEDVGSERNIFVLALNFAF